MQNCVKNNEPAVLFTLLSPIKDSINKNPNPILVLQSETSESSFKIVGDIDINKQEILEIEEV